MFQKIGGAKSVWKSRAAAIVGAAVVSSSLLLTAQAADKMAPMPKEQHESMKGDAKSVESMDMHKSMMKGMKEMESMPMTGNTDTDFAMMMKKHHESALDMANVELQQGKDPKLRSMAKNIISSQKQEIKEFDQWLAKHKQPMAEPMAKPK